jgi:hypothetical protein
VLLIFYTFHLSVPDTHKLLYNNNTHVIIIQ